MRITWWKPASRRWRARCARPLRAAAANCPAPRASYEGRGGRFGRRQYRLGVFCLAAPWRASRTDRRRGGHHVRSEEHTSELQSLMRISYAVFCLKKKKENCSTKSVQHHSQARQHTKTKANNIHTRPQ